MVAQQQTLRTVENFGTSSIASACADKLIDRVLEILNSPEAPKVLKTTELGKLINRDWRKVSSHLLALSS